MNYSNRWIVGSVDYCSGNKLVDRFCKVQETDAGKHLSSVLKLFKLPYKESKLSQSLCGGGLTVNWEKNKKQAKQRGQSIYDTSIYTYITLCVASAQYSIISSRRAWAHIIINCICECENTLIRR